MFNIIKKSIDKFDAKGLLDMGAPADEYDIESRDIASKINKDSSVDEIADICSEVFTHWFCTKNSGEKFTKEDFTETAREIWENINTH